MSFLSLDSQFKENRRVLRHEACVLALERLGYAYAPALRDGLGSGKTAMLVFYRSADCKTQLVELQGRLTELQAKGLGLAAISYDPVDTLAAFSRQRGITFPLLSDAGPATIKKYGILNPVPEAAPPAHEVLVGFGIAEHLWPFLLAASDWDCKNAEGSSPRQHSSIVVRPAVILSPGVCESRSP